MRQNVAKMVFSHTEASFLVNFTLACIFWKKGKQEVEFSVDLEKKSSEGP